jgi:divalent metal cation (Fe/Co/Zn/Cd) transporter
MTHEITMEKQELEKRLKKNLAFKTIHHVDSDDDEEEELDEDITLITRQY